MLFFLSLLIDKAAKPTNVYVVAIGHIAFYHTENASTDAVTSALSTPVFQRSR